MTDNPLPSHNNELVIGMICDNKECNPDLKVIVAIATSEAKQKTAAKLAKIKKKVAPVPQVVKTKMEPTPKKKLVLYVLKELKKEQPILSVPHKVDERKITLNVRKLYVPMGTSQVARGPRIPPRLPELVFIITSPQSPTKDPTAIPWNYNKTIITYKVKEVGGTLMRGLDLGSTIPWMS